MRFMLSVLLAAALMGCSPQMDGLKAGERDTVASVESGDTLVLKSGLKVRLTEIDAPSLREEMGKEARTALERMTANRPIQLAYGGTERGEDGRAFALAFVRTEGGRWVFVQKAMLLEGWARVRTHRENFARAEELYAAEAAARADKKGMWKQTTFRPVSADAIAHTTEEAIAAHPECKADETVDAKAPTDGDAARPARRNLSDFMLIEGKVASVNPREKDIYINFGADFSRDFAVRIPIEAAKNWPGGVAEIEALAQQKVRVRGMVARCRKPIMRADHPTQFEMLAKG